MAAPAYAAVGTETQTNPNSTSSTANIPASTANGDLLIMVVGTYNATTVTTPSGWTRIVNHVAWGSPRQVCVYWRIASSEPSSYSLSASASCYWQVHVIRITGAHATSPIDQVATNLTAGSTTSFDCPSVTTTGADRLICNLTFQPTSLVVTPPGGVSQRYDHNFAFTQMRQSFGDKTQAAAGASGTFTWTSGGAANQLGITIAVAPPGGAAPVADFSGTPLTGTWPLSVAFTDTSTNTPTSWSWTFGDTGTSSSQNPTHSYTAAGTYTVALTATNATGSDTKTRTAYITVSNPSGTFTKIKWGDHLQVTDEGGGVIRVDYVP